MNQRKFLGLTTIALVLVINQQVGSASKICDTPRCVQEAAKIKDYVDITANPCEDFYQFACGNFLTNPNVNNKYKIWKELKFRMFHESLDIAAEDIREDDHKMVKAAKGFYRKCLNEDQIIPDYIKTMNKIAKAAGGWPVLEGSSWNETNFNWLNAIYELRRQGYEYKDLLSVHVVTDRNTQEKILQVRQRRERFSYPDLKKVAKVALLLGAENEENVIQELRQTYDSFSQLERILQTYSNIEYISQTVEEIQEYADNIDWLEFLNKMVGPNIKISKTDKVQFPDYLLNGIENMEKWVPKRAQANYLMWEAIRPLYTFVEEFYSQRNGSQEDSGETREEYCSILISKTYTTSVPNPIAVIKLRRHLSTEKKIKVEKFVENVKAASIEGLNKINWLPENIKQKYLKQMGDLKVIVGLSEDYFDDKLLDAAESDMNEIEGDATFFDFVAQVVRNEESLKFDELKKVPKELIEGPYAPFDSWIEFRRGDYIYIPTVLCEEPFFDENRPEALNYANLGTLITKYLWEDLFIEARDEATGVKKCVIDNSLLPYSDNKETVLFDASRFSVAEQISFAAYEKSIKENGEDSKLISTEYTPNQLLWISFVSFSCEPTNSYEFIRMMRNFAKYELTKDVVTESFRLTPEFAKDFNCPVGSKLNPSNKCNLF